MAEQTIHFVCPVALRDVFDAIAPKFMRETGCRFETSVMLNPEVPDHIAQGHEWSIAASNPTYIQRVLAGGDCLSGVHHLGHSPLSLGMRGSNGEQSAHTRGAIADILLQAERIAITDGGTSGAQFGMLTDALGISRDVGTKVIALPGGSPMAALLAAEVDLAALPLTNVAPIEGVFSAAICPLEFGVEIELAFCLHRKANDATRLFANKLMNRALDDQLARLGLIR